MFLRQPFFPRVRARPLPLAVTVVVPSAGPQIRAFRFPPKGLPFSREAFFTRATTRILPLGLEVLFPIPGPPPKAFRFPPSGVPFVRRAFFPVSSPRASFTVIPPVSLPPPKAFGILQLYRPPFFPKAKVRWTPPKLTARGEYLETTPTVTDFNIYVLHIEDVRNEDGLVLDFWFSTKAMITEETDDPPDETFMELVDDPGLVKRQAFGSDRNSGFVSPTWGGASFNNAGRDFGDWINYSTDGAKVTCFFGPHRGDFPDEFRVAYIAYIDGRPSFSTTAMQVNYRGRERAFDQPVCTLGFDGTGEYEGTGVAGSSVRWLVMGTPGYREPILIDEVENVWFLQDNPLWIVPTVLDGGVEITYGGSRSGFGGGAADPGEFRIMSNGTYGPFFINFGSPVRVEARVYLSGLYGSETVTPRRWTISDLAQRAGILDASAGSMPAGCENFDAGNRVAAEGSYKDIFADIAQYEVASIGFTRLDKFYGRRIVPSAEATTVMEFIDGVSCRNVSFAPIPGLERRVWQVKVSAGESTKSALAGVVEDAYLDALNRDPWWTQYTVEVKYYNGIFVPPTPVRDLDPNAEQAVVEIVSNAFPDQSRADMLAFALRFLKLHAARQVSFSIEVELNLETLELELLDGIRFVTEDWGGTRFAIIWSIDYQFKARTIRLGLWSHTEVPDTDDLYLKLVNDTEGAAGGGAGSGATGQKESAPQIESFVIPCMAETTALVVSATKVRTFVVPYNFRLTEVIGSLITNQASGSVVTVDIKQYGTSILSTKLTIDNGEENSLGALVQPVISTPTLVKGQRVTFYVDQVGDGTARGLIVTLVGYQTA